MQRIPMTAAGHKVLETEVAHLRSVERHAIIKQIAEARAHGDLSENAEYHAAKERQSFIEGRVMDLEDKLSRAEVIDISKKRDVWRNRYAVRSGAPWEGQISDRRRYGGRPDKG